ncbi:MFS transporter [Candidatus Bathyarchaeota archaeon]|nr:MFS transporter [Candidatus Bathyarchaeota archaeon]
MVGFTIIWIGQMFSLLGTAMTQFAITIWAWGITQEVTALALIGFFSFAPIILMSPFAGALVDRYNRKKVMMLADFAAGMPTIAILLLYVTNNLQIWHLFITGAIAATFQAFHFPAYSAAITMMVKKEQYGRASGMLSIAQFAATIFAPVVAALLLTIVGIEGVLIIDIITFTTAVLMLLLVYIPQPLISEAGRKGMGSIWKQSTYGFRYIYERPSLLGLQLVFFCINLFGSFGNTVMTPMILARTGDNKIILGSVMSAGSVGGLVGSGILALWGGPKRKVHGILMGMMFVSLFGGLLMGFGRTPYIWTLAFFLSLLFLPIINGSNQAIWQAKVAPDVQGRVFATRLLIAQISVPIAMLLAGPLADQVFEPSMMAGGSLEPLFSGLVGNGRGAGMALMLVIAGVLGILVSLGGYAMRAVRKAEDILPDHDAKPHVVQDEK